jgi:hypothetical protein
MQENAMTDPLLNAEVLAEFDQLRDQPLTSRAVFPFDGDFAELHPRLARALLVFNATAAGFEVSAEAELPELREQLVPAFAGGDRAFKEKVEEMERYNSTKKADEPKREFGLADLNGQAVAVATGENKPAWRRIAAWLAGASPDVEKKQELIGYDYDGAFPLLIRYLTSRRHGLCGFVLAALMGAVISSLASMLNAASTIFTMDIYREYLNKNASQKTLVWVGRCCVPVFVLIGCLIAPQLANPKFRGAFYYIQEFQGYVSPGVLTIFLFGLFVPRTPRVCGVLGLVLSPIVYGLLHLFWGDVAFLDRMAITVGVLAAVLGIVTLARPLKDPLKLPTQTKIALESSSGAKVFGVVVVLATVALYVLFW